MNNLRHQKHLLIILCSVLVILLSACGSDDAVLPDQTRPQPSEQESIQGAEASNAQQESAEPSQELSETATDSSASQNAESPSSENTAESSGEIPTSTNSIAALPDATGAEPDPNSPFAQLSSEEQVKLLDWWEAHLDQYDKLAAAFDSFSSQQGDFSERLKKGDKISDIPAFQTLNSACSTVLDELDRLEQETLPAAADEMKASVTALNTWYRDFLSQLSQKSGQDAENLTSWLDQQVQQGGDQIQAVLDAIAKFRS